MANTWVQWATLIAASMGGLGSLYRIYQNERMYKLHNKLHGKKKKKKR